MMKFNDDIHPTQDERLREMHAKMMNANPLSDKAEAERRHRVVERQVIDSPPTLTSRIEVLEHTVSCQGDLINELRAELADLRALI